MLPRQNCGGGKDGALLAAHHALERRPQRHLGFADADIAAEQAVHRPRLSISCLMSAAQSQLVRRFLVGEALFKIALPGVVGGEGVAVGLLAAGVQLNQLFAISPWRPLTFCGSWPSHAQAAQLHIVAVARRGVAGQQIQLVTAQSTSFLSYSMRR